MYRKSGTGYVLVVVKSTHNVNTGRKGVDGKDIVIDIAFRPMEYALNSAVVYQLPFEMGTHAISQVPCGIPGYGPIRFPSRADYSPSSEIYAIGGVYSYKLVSDIEPEVEIGDKIYFKPRTLNNRKNYLGELKSEDGKDNKYIYKVPYENIFCTVRNGVINPIGAWLMIEPMWEDWGTILKPTYYADIKDEHGNPIPRPKKEWIQVKQAPEHDNMRGRVAHVGKPLVGEFCDIKKGMNILFRKQVKPFFQVIEGEKYIILPQDAVLAELKENVKVM